MLRKHDTNDFAIAKMIEECGGLEQIEMLQNHANPEIYHLAYELVEKFFSDDVDPEVVPDQNESFYVFKGGKNHMKYFSF